MRMRKRRRYKIIIMKEVSSRVFMEVLMVRERERTIATKEVSSSVFYSKV